ncbi:MAG: hypothetical protein LBE27_00185, partial [Deltaproteobacteria bacterium]|nr:hypothetical protein [Deltaproteobacteria bacterium]
MGLRLEAILGIVHNNKDISMTALAKRYVGFTLGETGFFEPKHEWANYKILEAYSFADVDEVIFKRIVIDILFILEGNRFLPIDFETDPLREGHTRKYIDNLSMIMANLEVLTKREIESKFYPDVKFHVVAGHRVKGEYELITKNTALGPIGTVFFLKDVDKEKKFSEILMKYRVCNILTVPDLSHLVILPMCGKELRFNRDFLKKSIELIQDFANKSISSPEVTEQCNWYKNLLFSTYSKMLTAEEWKEAYQVKDFTTIADAFVDYGK